MPKKRKCRYTEEEQAIHIEAVRLRKMTDRQLVDTFRRASENARRTAEANKPKERPPGIEKLLKSLAEGKCKGVGTTITRRIEEHAAEMGLL